MKPIFKIIAFIITFTVILFTGLCLFFVISIRPVSIKSVPVTYDLKKGSTSRTVANELKQGGIIRNEKVFLLLLKLEDKPIIAASYNLNKNMSSKTIITHLTKGTSLNQNKLVVPEGKNIRQLAKIIASNTSNSETDFMKLMNDSKYIDSLIDQYWFLTNDIKNKDIYYPLEGYLFPSTYNISNKNITNEEIITMMLDQMDNHLTKRKDAINKSGFTIHQFLTFASVVQSEGRDIKDFKKISSVFHNRLDIGMPLGSCVTTYYAVKINMNERNLYEREITAYNPYNTRGPNMVGKLPVGPISNPGEDAMIATLEPDMDKYLYFVADKYYNTYFTKTYAEHLAKIKELKNKGVWNEW